jgi:hypothetical protein
VKRAVLFAIALAVLGACQQPAPECFEFCGGDVRGVFHIGGRIIPDSRWVEMIELSGPPEERCGPGDCGVNAGALRVGVDWPPGTWRVMPPRVSGWITPDPIVIIVRKDELTTFQAAYRPA